MKDFKLCAVGLAIAAVVFLGARPSHAQNNYWPNSQPYACTYLLSNGTTGVSLVTLNLGPENPTTGQRSGTVMNLYPNGSSTTKQIVMGYDITVGGLYFYQPAENIYCRVDTYQYSRHLVFSSCSNGNRQDCRQWF